MNFLTGILILIQAAQQQTISPKYSLNIQEHTLSLVLLFSLKFKSAENQQCFIVSFRGVFRNQSKI